MTDLEEALADAITKTKAACSAINRASFEFDKLVRSLVAQPLTSRQMREGYTYAQHDGELWLCGDVLELALRRLRAMRREARRDGQRERAGEGEGRHVAPAQQAVEAR